MQNSLAQEAPERLNPRRNVVKIEDYDFTVKCIRVSIGDSICFALSSVPFHAEHILEGRSVATGSLWFESPLLQKGERTSFTMTIDNSVESGEYRVSCLLYTDMVCSVRIEGSSLAVPLSTKKRDLSAALLQSTNRKFANSFVDHNEDGGIVVIGVGGGLIQQSLNGNFSDSKSSVIDSDDCASLPMSSPLRFTSTGTFQPSKASPESKVYPVPLENYLPSIHSGMASSSTHPQNHKSMGRLFKSFLDGSSSDSSDNGYYKNRPRVPFLFDTTTSSIEAEYKRTSAKAVTVASVVLSDTAAIPPVSMSQHRNQVCARLTTQAISEGAEFYPAEAFTPRAAFLVDSDSFSSSDDEIEGAGNSLGLGPPSSKYDSILLARQPTHSITAGDRSVTVHIEDFSFRPVTLSIPVGSTVEFLAGGDSGSGNAMYKLVCEGEFEDVVLCSDESDHDSEGDNADGNYKNFDDNGSHVDKNSVPPAWSMAKTDRDFLRKMRSYSHTFKTVGIFDVRNEIFSFMGCRVTVYDKVPVTSNQSTLSTGSSRTVHQQVGSTFENTFKDDASGLRAAADELLAAVQMRSLSLTTALGESRKQMSSSNMPATAPTPQLPLTDRNFLFSSAAASQSLYGSFLGSSVPRSAEGNSSNKPRLEVVLEGIYEGAGRDFDNHLGGYYSDSSDDCHKPTDRVAMKKKKKKKKKSKKKVWQSEAEALADVVAVCDSRQEVSAQGPEEKVSALMEKSVLTRPSYVKHTADWAQDLDDDDVEVAVDSSAADAARTEITDSPHAAEARSCEVDAVVIKALPPYQHLTSVYDWVEQIDENEYVESDADSDVGDINAGAGSCTPELRQYVTAPSSAMSPEDTSSPSAANYHTPYLSFRVPSSSCSCHIVNSGAEIAPAAEPSQLYKNEIEAVDQCVGEYLSQHTQLHRKCSEIEAFLLDRYRKLEKIFFSCKEDTLPSGTRVPIVLIPQRDKFILTCPDQTIKIEDDPVFSSDKNIKAKKGKQTGNERDRRSGGIGGNHSTSIMTTQIHVMEPKQQLVRVTDVNERNEGEDEEDDVHGCSTPRSAASGTKGRRGSRRRGRKKNNNLDHSQVEGGK